MKSKETSPGMLLARSVRKKTPPLRTLTRWRRSPEKSLRISLAIARILLWIRAAEISGRTLSFCPGLFFFFAALASGILFPRSRNGDSTARPFARQLCGFGDLDVL